MSIPNPFRPVCGKADGWRIAELTPSTWTFDELTPLGIPYAGASVMTPEEVFATRECLRDGELGVVLFGYHFRSTVIENAFQYNYYSSFSPTPVPPRLQPPYGDYGKSATPALEIHVLGKPRRVRLNVIGSLKLDACYATADNWASYFALTPVASDTGGYLLETQTAITSLCLNEMYWGNVNLSVVKLETK